MIRPIHWLAVGMAAAALSLAGCGEKRTAAERIDAAYQNIDATRYRDAVIDLRNLLRGEPDNAGARVALGIALLGVGDAAAAEKELERARDLGAPPEDYIESWARALQGRGAHAEVIAEIDPGAVSDPELSSTLRALRGRSMLALGSQGEAEKIFDAELVAGQSVEAQRMALLGKSAIAAVRGDVATAESLARRAHELVPDSAEALLTLARILLSQNRFAEALAAIDDADAVRTGRTDRFMLTVQRMEAHLGLGDLAAARTASEQLVRMGKDHPMVGFLLGRLEFEDDNPKAAVEHFQSVLSSYPDFIPARTLLGAALLKTGDLEQAELMLDRAVAGNPGNAAARQLLAETRLRMQKPEAAMATLRDGLRGDKANPELLAMLGRATVQLGDHDAGLEYLRQAMSASPDNLQARLSMASAYVSMGRGAEAVEILESLPEGAIEEKRREVLILIAKLDRENPDDAQAQLEELLAKSPDDVFIISLAGSYYASVGRIDEARARYERILQLEPDNRTAKVNLMRMDETSGDFSRSRALFEKAYQEDPTDLFSALLLARIYQLQGDRDRSLAILRQANERDATALFPNLILTSDALARNDLAAAERYATAAVTAHPEVAQAQAADGLVKMRQARFEEALASLSQAVRLDDDVHSYRYYLGHAQWVNGRLAQARDSFQRALELDPNHLPSLRSLAILEIRAENVERAESLIADLQRQAPDEPAVLEIVGDVRAVQGRMDEAIDYFERAQARELSWPRAAKLYQVRLRNGDSDPMRSLRQWVERAPDDASARLMLAQALQREGRSEGAIEQYEAVILLEPDSPLALNNLAWLYMEAGGTENLARARELGEKAHGLAPQNADVADTFGWILVRSGRMQEGIDVLRRALATTSAGNKPDIAFHLAVALNESGDADAARRLLREALAATAPFVSRDAAQALYDTL